MGHKTRSVVSLFAVVTAVLLSPDLQLYLLDTSYSVVAWLDGVDEYNSRQPSYTTGNWVPVHREMDNVEVGLEGGVARSGNDGPGTVGVRGHGRC